MKAPNKEAVIGCLESGLFRFAFFSLPVSVNSLLYYKINPEAGRGELCKHGMEFFQNNEYGGMLYSFYGIIIARQ